MSPRRIGPMAKVGGCVAGLAAAAVLTAPAVAAPDEPRPAPGGPRLLAVPVGAAPTITSAPPALGNDTTPTVAWTGAEPLFTWELSDATGTVVERYTGPETTATTATVLTDGSYTFTVWQHNLPDGPRSAAATTSFSIDATAPAAPRIIGRPPFPTTITTPAFALDGFESGAAASWLVVAAGGAVAQGPQPVSGPVVTLGSLPTGSYVFQVRQTDPAGNQSAPASEPFAIISATVVPTPTTARRRLILPKMNTARLRPRVGAEVPTVRPVLAWARGPRGTTVYNVQVFRVGAGSSENAAAVKLTKLRSMFPRARQVRLRGLKRGQCYVWRVWPFIGARFTAKPLGVSNFCVAARAPRGRAGR